MEAQHGKSMKMFLVIWIGQVLSSVGTAIARFAVVWWIASLTGSATALATVTMMSQIPRVFLSPVAGALIDRWDRKRLLVLSDGAIALASLALAVLFWSGKIQVWHVFAVMLFQAIVHVFNSTAMLIVTGQLVPDQHLTRVAGMNQTLNGALNVAGPLLGALALTILPLGGIMLIDVCTAVLAILPLLFVAVPRIARAVAEKRPSVMDDLKGGVRYVRAWPGLMALLAGAALANFVLNPAFSMTPLLITKHFGGGALELSWLESAFGFGVIAGGLALSTWGGFKRKIQTTILGAGLCALGVLTVGLAPASALWMGIGGIFVAGMSLALIDGPFLAILQRVVAQDMQGRVFSLTSALSGVAAPLGLALLGPLADRVGIPPLYVACGVVLAAVALMFGFSRSVLQIEEDGARLRAANGATQAA